MRLHILGIRHHGPGSAGNVQAFLATYRPDLILIEGPPELDGLLKWLGHEDTEPPVAVLAFDKDQPQRGTFYPFAVFSPEWQALQFGIEQHIPIRFIDLPLMHSLALDTEDAQGNEPNDAAAPPPVLEPHPFEVFASITGFRDGEDWWDHTFESGTPSLEVFEAIHHMMAELRPDPGIGKDRREALREAFMRREIRRAQAQGYQSIAVICGAWHEPALLNMPPVKADNELLRNLPKCKVEVALIPWTYSRLMYRSGYGAGIESPGWYGHIWAHPEDQGELWMAKVAANFRKANMDISVAHVIESVRLARSLAALRGLHRPGLAELNEATQSVMCLGDAVLMELVRESLIVSNRIGSIPEQAPRTPLQYDLEAQQKRLRIRPEAGYKVLTLDLRKELDVERSIFFHRLNLLEITWAGLDTSTGKGTFKEAWRLDWAPEQVLQINERGIWGNTLEEAAASYAIHQAQKATGLDVLSELLARTLPATLPSTAMLILDRIEQVAALSSDVYQMMTAFVPMAQIVRYGDVRKTDTGLVSQIIGDLLVRICSGLSPACSGIDAAMATRFLESMAQLQQAIALLEEESMRIRWTEALAQLALSEQAHPLLDGYACRLLHDSGGYWSADDTVRHFRQALSQAVDPVHAAYWIEGFLQGSAWVLLLDENLWSILEDWLQELEPEHFTGVLPLLRRTFSHYSAPERAKIGAKARQTQIPQRAMASSTIEETAAIRSLEIIGQLFGWEQKTIT